MFTHFFQSTEITLSLQINVIFSTMLVDTLCNNIMYDSDLHLRGCVTSNAFTTMEHFIVFSLNCYGS